MELKQVIKIIKDKRSIVIMVRDHHFLQWLDSIKRSMDSLIVVKVFTTITAIVVIVASITFITIIEESSNLDPTFGALVKARKLPTIAASSIFIELTDFISP